MLKKLILVEDDPSLALALEMRLKAIGYKLIVADSVASALSKIVMRKPDVSLIDINLPDGTGFNLAEQIVKHPQVRETPIIFITASKNRKHRELSQSYCPVAYLEKPFSAGELIDAIESAPYLSGIHKAYYKSYAR